VSKIAVAAATLSARERRRFDGQFEEGRELFQGTDATLIKAIRRIGEPCRIDAIHLTDDALGGKPMNEHQDVGRTLVAGLRNGWEIGWITCGQTTPHHLFARLQQMEERAAAPVLRCLTLVGASVIYRLGHLSGIGAPPESTALVD
jgi:hypothetical protein